MDKITVIRFSFDQVRATLAAITGLIKQDKVNGNLIALARGIAGAAGAVGDAAEAEAVRAWIHANITFRNDPEGVEYVQDAQHTLTAGAGDCDCMATLAGTLLAALGHEVYPLGCVWAGEDAASHCVLYDDSAELIVDPVPGDPAGNWPPAGYILDHFVRA